MARNEEKNSFTAQVLESALNKDFKGQKIGFYFESQLTQKIKQIVNEVLPSFIENGFNIYASRQNARTKYYDIKIDNVALWGGGVSSSCVLVVLEVNKSKNMYDDYFVKNIVVCGDFDLFGLIQQHTQNLEDKKSELERQLEEGKALFKKIADFFPNAKKWELLAKLDFIYKYRYLLIKDIKGE